MKTHILIFCLLFIGIRSYSQQNIDSDNGGGYGGFTSTNRIISKNNQTSGEGEIVCNSGFRIKYTYSVKALYNTFQEVPGIQNDAIINIIFQKNTDDELNFRLTSSEIFKPWTSVRCPDAAKDKQYGGRGGTGDCGVKLSPQEKNLTLKVSNVETTKFMRVDVGTKLERNDFVYTKIPCEVSFNIKLPPALKPIEKVEAKKPEPEKENATLILPSGNSNQYNAPVKSENKANDAFWNEGGNNKSGTTTNNSTNTNNTIRQESSVSNAQVAEQYRQQAAERRNQIEQQNRLAEQQRVQDEARRKQEESRRTMQYIEQLETQTQHNAQVVKDAVNSFTDIIVQQQMKRAEEENEERKRRQEEDRLEEEARAQRNREIEEQQRRVREKQDAQNSFIRSIPAFVPISNRSDISLREVYYFFIIRNADIIYLSNPFPVRRYSDDTWPYRADIEQKIQSAENGNSPFLLGHYKTKQEALRMLDVLNSEAGNSYFNTQILNFTFKDYSSEKTTNSSTPSGSKNDFWNQ